MWKNMDDRLERRRELLSQRPGPTLEEEEEVDLGNLGGPWREGDNAFPRLVLLTKTLQC